jgi:hypothetical protein
VGRRAMSGGIAHGLTSRCRFDGLKVPSLPRDSQLAKAWLSGASSLAGRSVFTLMSDFCHLPATPKPGEGGTSDFMLALTSGS